MVRLFINYYKDADSTRNNELFECLEKNIKNDLINEVYLLVEAGGWCPPSKTWMPTLKAKMIFIHERPTFEGLFIIANSFITNENDISIIANSDIYFDETLQYTQRMNRLDAYALTRYDVVKGVPVFLNRRDSQDCWVFRGQIRPSQADFPQGVGGADNVLAYRLHLNGYNVSNPSLSIKTYHLHESGVRRYEDKDRLPMPYKLLTPHR